MEVGQPTQLAKLPRAGIAGDGKIQFCQVYGVQDGHRKKRQEICAVVDGSSVNVVEVVNGRNIVSWPVPPDTTFLCAPFSERTKVDDSPRRRTWCVVKRRDHRSIECYEEAEIDKDTRHSTSSCVIESPAARIVSLQPFGSDAAVAVQEDGRVTTGLHGKEIPQSNFSIQESAVPLTILASEILSADGARNSVFKSRPDLASALSHTSMVIAAIYTTTESLLKKLPEVRLGIWSFEVEKNRDNDKVEPIISYKIGCSDLNTTTRQVRFTSDVRKLQISDRASTMIFNLTTTYPQHLTTRKHLINDTTSEVELANSIFLSITPEKFHIYNANFNSTLLSLPRTKTGSKRKRDRPMAVDMSVIAYFSQLRRVVAADNNFIYSIDIHADRAAPRPFQKSSLLIGNILRGSEQTNPVPGSKVQSIVHIGKMKSEKLPDQWQRFSKELDALAARHDVLGFERKLLQAIDQKSFGDLLQSAISPDIIDYILSKIFQRDEAKFDAEDNTYELKVALLAPKLLNWLIQGGHLEENRVLRVLKMGASTSNSSFGCVIQALFEIDAELTIVQDYIKKSPHIRTRQLCSIIKHLLATAVAHSQKNMHKQLRHELKAEMDRTNDPKAVAVGVGPDELTASTATTQCLSLALKRLALAGSTNISKHFRGFDQQDILALIQFLRQQLFLGGYTRLVENWKSPGPVRSPSSDNDGQPKNPNPQISLKNLVLLLNGCVDALGMVGILGSENNENFIQDMLPELLSEITTATKAVEDSTYLQGLVRETLRYAESVERQPFEVRSRMQKKSTNFNRRGEVVTLYAEPDTEETGIDAGSALPLSLKSAEDINKFKVRKGGGQVDRRSAREMGMLKDRLKSSYTFERLIL